MTSPQRDFIVEREKVRRSENVLEIVAKLYDYRWGETVFTPRVALPYGDVFVASIFRLGLRENTIPETGPY